MDNFSFYTPTKIVFGKDTETQAGALIKEFGGSRVLIHYGQGSVIRSGLLDRVCESLEKENLYYVKLGGAKPNPRLGLVYEGIELCRKESIDFILAVGGGSALDSAKAIAMGLEYDGDVWDLFDKKIPAEKMAPVGCVLTIAATGSEMSGSCVITNENGNLKRGNVRCDACRPVFSVLNPSLTATLPEYQTMSGCVDIMMHTLERFFSHEHNTFLTDELAESILKTVIYNAKILIKDPENYDARSEILWAGSLSHNNLTGLGRKGDWACHQLEHELSGMFDVTHGAGLAAIWASWARYVYKEDVARFTKLATDVFNIPYDYENPENTALAGIEAMEDFFKKIHMPVSISELGVELDDDTINKLAYSCSFEGKRTVGTVKVLDTHDMEEIYKMAR